ncbi:MAG: maleylacetoacetate isomerase [Hyphomicrobiales bacterium]|nr:maleylacetoacetate isomerase [Hyphomicrobiales bacterium]MCP4997820.1 maleylacetoacetate isomerase [Hyphomicrobiales bacterium]
MAKPVLYDYWRSSASYRVRIALNLLGIDYEAVAVDLLKKQHLDETHRARNPQGLVPALEIDGEMLNQSLAIVEYLDETRSAGFLPGSAIDRARVRTLSYIIAMEIHPVCNLSVVADVMARTGGGDQVRSDWMQTYIRKGLVAFEQKLGDGRSATFCHGDAPTMADICLVPQIYNANRWGAELSDLKRINAIVENCAALDAFAAAHPDRIGPPG